MDVKGVIFPLPSPSAHIIILNASPLPNPLTSYFLSTPLSACTLSVSLMILTFVLPRVLSTSHFVFFFFFSASFLLLFSLFPFPFSFFAALSCRRRPNPGPVPRSNVTHPFPAVTLPRWNPRSQLNVMDHVSAFPCRLGIASFSTVVNNEKNIYNDNMSWSYFKLRTNMGSMGKQEQRRTPGDI